MIHHFLCDNCGRRVVSHCFSVSKDHMVIWDPPLEDDLDAEEMMLAVLTRKFTIICGYCIDEDIDRWEAEGGS